MARLNQDANVVCEGIGEAAVIVRYPGVHQREAMNIEVGEEVVDQTFVDAQVR